MKNNRLTITEVAKGVGVTPRTIMRWEKAGKIKKSKRDWRGWRIYFEDDLKQIKDFYETFYEFDEENGNDRVPVTVLKKSLIIAAMLSASLLTFNIYGLAESDTNQETAVSETKTAVNIDLSKLPAVNTPPTYLSEPIKYTLGPDDIIDIEVRRHPEFSGQYPITSEGKIEYKYIGDVIVAGLTKNQLKDRITEILSEYIIEPEVNIRIVAYLSKVFYVVGEVGRPGKFYMRGDTIPVREALVQASLPTLGAAMRRCRLITPDQKGSRNFVQVDVYRLLYEGDLKCNLDMQPGDVLYVPATVMAKIIHVISPVTGAAGQATTAATQGATAAAIMAP